MSKNETIEIDEAVVEAVAAKAAEAVKGSFVMPTAGDIAKEVAALSEKTIKKDIHEDVEKKDETTVTSTNKFEKMSKEMRFARGLTAHKMNNAVELAEYNAYVNKAWREVNKANYQNVTTTADGGALVPDPEFVAEVERLTQEYGTASRLATIRRTDRDSVTLLSGTNEISFTSTSEATAQNAQKLTYASATASLNKYIATLVFTSEVLEDAAVNLWTDATNEIARARAKLFDQLVFTDATYGLLYQPDAGEGWKTQTVGSAITDLTFDDLMDARFQVLSPARRNGRFFMHPTVWNYLRQKKSGDGTNSSAQYYAGGPLNAVEQQIDGVPVELVDVLPAYGEITANEPFAVFGDLSHVKIHVKRLLETKVFDAGVVKDAGGSDINLITQDAWAMRATLRCVPQVNLPGRFCVIGTGTVS